MTRSQQIQHGANIKPILTQDTQPQTEWEPIQISIPPSFIKQGLFDFLYIKQLFTNYFWWVQDK